MQQQQQVLERRECVGGEINIQIPPSSRRRRRIRMADSRTLLSLVSHLICISIANCRPFMDLLVLVDV